LILPIPHNPFVLHSALDNHRRSPFKNGFLTVSYQKRGDSHGRFGSKHDSTFISGTGPAHDKDRSDGTAQLTQVGSMTFPKDYITEEEIEEADLYFEDRLAELAENDILSGAEEGFMTGYLQA
jgi:hypothetical protein